MPKSDDKSDEMMSVKLASTSTAKSVRRTAIVEAARRRFRATGLAGTTLEMVATDAGLARPHLYRFFKNKAELIAAVVAVETSEINARRRQQIAELHSFADQLVRSLELAVELVYSDDFWSSLITPGNVPYTAYAASSAPEILAANTDYWTPMLRAAEDSGELRPSLDHQKVMTWLLGIQFMFMERSEIFPTIADVGYYARTFVLPALVTGTDG